MSVISNTVNGMRLAARGLSRTLGNRGFQAFAAFLLVGALLSPVFVPLVHGTAYALLAGASTVAFGYPAMKLVGDGLRHFFGVMIGSSRSSRGSVSGGNERVNHVSDGQATGNALVDALADKLRKNGLKVSTDWKEGEKILKELPEKYDHLKKEKDSLRGFVYQGVIFLNPKNADESVPIHEYTHLWAEALRQKDADSWKAIVSLVKKETALWESVKTNYPHLETDDEIADEVLATYSGQRGMQRLAEFTGEGAKPKDVFSNLLQALEMFWKGVGKFFGIEYKSIDEVADRALYDLLSGMDPNKYIDQNKITLSDRTPLASRNFDSMTFISRKEAAQVLNTTIETVDYLIKSKLIECDNRNGRDYINREAFTSKAASLRDISDKIKAVLSIGDAEKAAIRHSDIKSEENSLDINKFNKIISSSVLSLANCAKDSLLDNRQYHVICRYFKGENLQTIAGYYDLTKNRIYQILVSAVNSIGDLKSYASLQQRISELEQQVTILKASNARLSSKVGEIHSRLGEENTTILDDHLRRIYQIQPDTLRVKFTTPLDNFDLTTRVRNGLRFLDIQTLGELVQYKKYDLFKINNLGKGSIDELTSLLDSVDLHFGMDVHQTIDDDFEQWKESHHATLGDIKEGDKGFDQYKDLLAVAREYATGKGLRSTEQWLQESFDNTFAAINHPSDIEGVDGVKRLQLAQHVVYDCEDSLTPLQSDALGCQIMSVAQSKEQSMSASIKM